MPREVRAERINLRHPKNEDAAEFIEKSIASAEFHKGLVTPPTTEGAFMTYVLKDALESNECFLICNNSDDGILGAINLSQIFHGGFKSAYLGYYLFNGFGGVGYATEAVNAIVKFSFIDLRLHRIEANIQPHNYDSIELVKNCGFTKEGFSRKYLQIDGDWRDHERWAIIREDLDKEK